MPRRVVFDAEDQSRFLRDLYRLREVVLQVRRRVMRSDRVDVHAQHADRLDRFEVRP